MLTTCDWTERPLPRPGESIGSRSGIALLESANHPWSRARSNETGCPNVYRGVGTRLATACLMVAILVTASCGASQGVSRAGDESPEMSPQQSGTWNKISKAPDGSSEPEGTLWIMNRLVVVAGSTIEAWVPERDEWKVVAEIPQAEQCEGCGYSETVVWTGEDLLLWGRGFSYRAPTVAGRSSGRRGKAG